MSDAPVLEPKYANVNLNSPTIKADDPGTKFGVGLLKVPAYAFAAITEMFAQAHYGSKVPKENFAKQFPLAPNDNIAKDMFMPILTTPVELMMEIKKDPTNAELWGEASAIFLLAKGKITKSEMIGGSRDINPLRGEYNCAGCTIAGDASLKGYPASALNHGVLLVKDFLSWFDAKTMEKHVSPNSIIKLMDKLEDGATGVIFGHRGNGKIGHFFNVVKQDGKVQFVDFQQEIGARSINPNTLMKEGKYESLYFLNTTPTK
ncbi:MAG: hypothetical protein KF862_16645 [Chitinophagaceae bacterium]|nr:hypothetical protein [Chitinophagaceae bacterium]